MPRSLFNYLTGKKVNINTFAITTIEYIFEPDIPEKTALNIALNVTLSFVTLCEVPASQLINITQLQKTESFL